MFPAIVICNDYLDGWALLLTINFFGSGGDGVPSITLIQSIACVRALDGNVDDVSMHSCRHKLHLVRQAV